MLQVQFRLIFNPGRKRFEFTVGQNPMLVIKGPMWDETAPMVKKWSMTAKETEQFIQNARKQLADATDCMTEFTLQPGDYTVDLKGTSSREVFKGVVDYLNKVWDSFKGSKYYAEVYAQ